MDPLGAPPGTAGPMMPMMGAQPGGYAPAAVYRDPPSPVWKLIWWLSCIILAIFLIAMIILLAITLVIWKENREYIHNMRIKVPIA